MPAHVELTLRDPGRVFGVKRIEMLLDGKLQRHVTFGEVYRISCNPGRHTIGLLLHGFLKRRSNILQFHVEDNETARIEARYRRFWGNFILEAE